MKLIISSKKHGPHALIIDNEDYPLVSQYEWCLNKAPEGKTFYARRYFTENGKRKGILLHREILEISDSRITIDHINGNGLDNRKENLRSCTKQQNSRNMGVKRAHETSSQYKGVSWFSRDSKWKSYITIDGKYKHLGLYDSEFEAAYRYDEAAIKNFGSFARLNFPK